MADHPRSPVDAAERETARLEAFSDGVFAIAITLLILELKVPPMDTADLRAALLARWPSYLAYLTSFGTVGVMWLNHHRIFSLIKRCDHTTLVLNLLLLLGVSVVPFPTALVAEHLGHPGERLAVTIYASVSVVIAVAFTALWRYVSSRRHAPPLMHVSADSRVVRTTNAQYRWGVPAYLVALAIAQWSPRASVILCLTMVLVFLFRAPVPDGDPAERLA